ncbi:MAG: M23 family peptidase, partial [Burkholderiaceae bacterium]
MSLQPVVTAIHHWAHTHRRGLVVGVGAVFTGLAATAFGLAPLAPDATDLPRQVISQPLQPTADVPAQLEALSEARLELYRSEVTRRQDTVESLFARLGVNDAAAAAFIRQDKQARKLLEGRPNKMVRAKADPAGRLIELVARYPAEQRNLADTHFIRLTLS